MSKVFQLGTSSTMGHGGGTIKRQKLCALLLVLAMAVSILPSAVGASDQSASDNNAKIGLEESKNVIEVNAAYKTKKTKKVKKTKKYKKVKAAYKTKKTKKVKKTKKYKKVKASSTYKKSSYTASGTANTFNDTKLDSIMKSAAGYGYRRGVSTAAGLVKNKAGDCWAYSEYLDKKFKAAGYQSRVIQYATSYSSRHRSVQLYQDGKWKTVPYKAYGYNYLIM